MVKPPTGCSAIAREQFANARRAEHIYLALSEFLYISWCNEMRTLTRIFMVLFGIATFIVYTAVAVAGLLALRWFLSNPPDPATFAITFVIVAVLGAYFGYRSGIARLAASLDATELSEHRAPSVHRRVDRLSERMEVTPPRILVADLGAPNALSVGGPKRGAVILDRRLADLLTLEELEAIIAHELAHIERYDAFLNTLALTFIRLLVTIVFLFLFPVFVFLVGIDRAAGWIFGRPRQLQYGLSGLFRHVAALVLIGLFSLFTLLFLAHSRRQEYRADRRAAAVTDNPTALARALTKIHRATRAKRGLQSLLYIHDDPERDSYRLLSTHPPLEKRIDRLIGESETTAGHRPSSGRDRSV